MKHLLAIAFITLLALGMGCAWISPSSQTTSDGIQVHGHWTVTVSNPDGSVDAVHEFDNEFRNWGALSGLIMGINNVDYQSIDVHFESNNAKCSNANVNIGPPLKITSDMISILQATAALTKTDGLPVRLSANCTVEVEDGSFGNQSGKISEVETNLYDVDNCWAYDQPGADPIGQTANIYGYHCPNMSGSLHTLNSSVGLGYLTSHSFQPFIEVFDKQEVSFTVKISFE